MLPEFRGSCSPSAEAFRDDGDVLLLHLHLDLALLPVPLKRLAVRPPEEVDVPQVPLERTGPCSYHTVSHRTVPCSTIPYSTIPVPCAAGVGDRLDRYGGGGRALERSAPNLYHTIPYFIIPYRRRRGGGERSDRRMRAWAFVGLARRSDLKNSAHSHKAHP